MQGVAQRRYEDGGRPVVKWRLGLTGRTGVEGEFSLASEYLPAARDHAMMARIRSAAGDEILPPLYQGAVTYWKDDEVHVSGLEHDAALNKFSAQKWVVVVLPRRVVVRLRYDYGQPLANRRADAAGSDGIEGRFSLVEESAKELNDRVLVARLVTDSGIIVPPLLRASVRIIKGNLLSVTGLEHNAAHNQYTAQAWAGEITEAICV